MRTILILFLLAGCVRQLPAPQYERPPLTPTKDLKQVEWLGPKPTLADVDQYVENFRKLAFWTEWNGSNPYIKKWTGAVVCVSKSDRFHDEVMATLLKLTVATGIQFRKGHKGCSISFVDGINAVGCRIAPSSKAEEFKSFLIGIGRGFDDFGECIEEEISQIMGLYNDIDYRWTMWNDNNNGTVNRLTWHDAVMLRVLYQDELYQGMPEVEAMKIIPALMRRVILQVR